MELLLDTNVASYLYKGGELGARYSELIGGRSAGITLLALAELRSGVVHGSWAAKRVGELDAFLSRFLVAASTADIANICGALIGQGMHVGRVMHWPDAWAAATAIWLDVPLVTHDRDLEGIPGLQVLTVHREWRIREESSPRVMRMPMTLKEREQADEEFAVLFRNLVAELRRTPASLEGEAPEVRRRSSRAGLL